MQAICFDMDGVILEGPRTDPNVYADAADEALVALGAEPTADQRRDLRRNRADAVRERCDALEIEPSEFWSLKERYASEGTHERVRSGERGAYDDVDAIADLCSRDRPLTALVTNNRHATARFVDDHFSFGFDAVRGRDPTIEGYERRKPDPHYLKRTLDELGVDVADGDRALYVGDSEKDVVAGRAAGLETAFLRRPHNRTVTPEPPATYELESLADLYDVVGGEKN
ncbi:HAD family hydrolase [Natrialbaceae archaeon GCM10025810]|uniref:HAD family hydrolase n=1 Tax=Halovalidus salilacus TaxID=3075124 RepID=UPI0036118293